MSRSHQNTAAKSPAGATRRVFIVDDHPVFREGLAQLVNGEEGLAVCGQGGSFAEALTGIRRTTPDLVLVDITLPDKSGLELIKEIRVQNRTVKLLVVSMHDEALYANRVLRLGGDGYIMKQEGPAEMVNAIHDVLGGHIYVSERVMMAPSKRSVRRPAKPAARPLDQLTDSELEILELLGQGRTAEEVAKQLRLKVQAVQTECAAMKKKLNLKSENALVRYAVCWVETGAT